MNMPPAAPIQTSLIEKCRTRHFLALKMALFTNVRLVASLKNLAESKPHVLRQPPIVLVMLYYIRFISRILKTKPLFSLSGMRLI